LCFRVAEREIESWALADEQTFSMYFGVATKRLPQDPDALADPKQALVNLCRRSSRRETREGIVPREGSGRSVGPLYVALLRDYARHWSVTAACERSQSVRRAFTAMETFVAGGRWLAA
jgi:hypothetical protein